MEPIQELSELICQGRNERLAQIIQENPEFAGLVTEQGISLLQFACYCRNSYAVDLLKQHRSSLDIFEAICTGDHEKVNHLLDHNPELVNSYSNDGFTPLGLAVFFGHLELVGFLLKAGANSNAAAKNEFKVAPIHSACAISNFSIAELLLKNGANVNARQMKGITPLHSAAHNGHTKLAELLILSGADVNATTEDGQTALFMAKEKKYDEVADLLIKNGGILSG